jgi:hypothetical protein
MIIRSALSKLDEVNTKSPPFDPSGGTRKSWNAGKRFSERVRGTAGAIFAARATARLSNLPNKVVPHPIPWNE